MIRAERTASHSISTMAQQRDEAIGRARSARRAELLVLQRHRAGQPHAYAVGRIERRAPRASARMRVAGRRAGLELAEVELGAAPAMILRSSRGSALPPPTSARQEKKAGLPASSCLQGVGEPAHRRRPATTAGSVRRLTPCSAVSSALISPRSDGSAAIGPRNGSAAISRSMLALDVAPWTRTAGPPRPRTSPPSGRRTEGSGPGRRPACRLSACAASLGQFRRRAVDHHDDLGVGAGEQARRRRSRPGDRAAWARAGRRCWC